MTSVCRTGARSEARIAKPAKPEDLGESRFLWALLAFDLPLVAVGAAGRSEWPRPSSFWGEDAHYFGVRVFHRRTLPP